MQQNPHIQRAMMLFETSRYAQAEEELRRGLAIDPDDARAHSLLAFCLTERKQYNDATAEASQGIHLAPEDPFSHFAMSSVMLERNRLDESQQSIQQAILLAPGDAEFRGRLAEILYARRRWQETLDAADQGLQLDPENDSCINMRAMALVKLGKSEAAAGTIGDALARDPDNAFTHANLGWTLIEQGDHKKALAHFREALRIDPTLEFAKLGIVEALKSRNFVYRWLLAWFLWMNKLSSQGQWFILIGAYVLYHVLRSVAENNPNLAPYITPILVIYIVFAVMTWMASPLFNLLLRLDKDGKLALSNDQIRTANWVGCAVLAAIICLAGWFIQGNDRWLIDAVAFGLLIPPLSSILRCHSGWPRNWMIAITVGMLAALAGILTSQLIELLVGGDLGSLIGALGSLTFLAYLLAGLATQFAANYFVSAIPRR